MHVILPCGSDFMAISSDIQRTMRQFGVRSATIQPEYVDPEVNMTLDMTFILVSS